MGAYWPVLGLVVGPGFVLGVGLVVAGVSVPAPPMPDPPEGMLEEDPLLVPLLLEPDGMLPVPVLGLLEPPLEPEPEPLPSPEPPPVVPAHALSNTAQAMDIIHLVIDRSRKDKKAVRAKATYLKTALTCLQ